MNNNIKYAIQILNEGFIQTKYSFTKNILDAKLYKTKRAAQGVKFRWLSPQLSSSAIIVKVKVSMEVI